MFLPKNNVGYCQHSMTLLKCDFAEALSSSDEAMLKEINWSILGIKKAEK